MSEDGGNFTPSPCWFSFNNSENGKSCIPGGFQDLGTFHQKHPFQIQCPLPTPVSRYYAKLRRGVSNFQISGQSLTKVICHNSRTSNDIDMKFGPLTKIEKRNKTVSKILENHVMQANCEITQSIKFTFSLTAAFYLTKTENN